MKLNGLGTNGSDWATNGYGVNGTIRSENKALFIENGTIRSENEALLSRTERFKMENKQLKTGANVLALISIDSFYVKTLRSRKMKK